MDEYGLEHVDDSVRTRYWNVARRLTIRRAREHVRRTLDLDQTGVKYRGCLSWNGFVDKQEVKD
jgi:hypothetical protein